MNAKVAALFVPLILSACAHTGMTSDNTRYGGGAQPIIKTATEETRKQLDIAPDELLLAVKQDGSIVLYDAPKLGIVRIDKDVNFDPTVTNQVGLSVIPASKDACYMVIVGGAKYWFAKPPCPITR